jgi:hypothetical protein
MTKYLIEFNSVFDANEGIKLINKVRFIENQQLQRSHHFGSLKFEIESSERYLLRHYKIGFSILEELK